MNTVPRSLSGRLSAALLVAAAAHAQDVAPLEGRLYPQPDALLFDADLEGRQWVFGRTYKASCGPRGFVYVPFLGSDAPRNEPVGLRVGSVHVGGEPLELTDAGDPSRDGDTLAIDRGPLEVLHHCAMESVEQVFVLDPQPWRGEVRVSVEVESASRPAPQGAGLRFHGERGWVNYGAAVAIAPDGRRCQVRSVLTEAGFDLVVPESFARSIEGRLVIDPVLSTGPISVVNNRDDISVDAGADPDIGFVAAVERAFSAADHDVFLYHVPVNATSGTLAATVDFTSTTWTEPSVAGRGQFDEFLTVATVGTGSARSVRGREVTGGTWSAELPFQISGAREAYSPDVGADHIPSFFSSNRWAVVYEEVGPNGKDIAGCMVSTNGVVGAPFGLANTVSDETHPRISESAGPAGPESSQAFNVVYLREQALGAEIMGRRVFHSGSRTIPNLLVPLSNVVSLDVTGGGDVELGFVGRPYLVVYGTRAIFGNGRFIHATMCVNGDAYETTNIAELNDMEVSDRHTAPVAAVSGDQWHVAYETAADPSSPREIQVASGSFAAGHFGLRTRQERASSSSFDDHGPAMASLYEGGGTQPAFPRTLLAWTVDAASPYTNGAQLVVLGGPVAGHQYCEAAEHSGGQSAWMTIIGDTDVQSIKTLRVTDLPIGQFCLPLTSRTSAYVPGIGGSAGNLCLGSVGFGRFNNMIGMSDSSGVFQRDINPQNLPQPFGFVPALVGETWHFQVWFRDFQGAPTSNLTNAFALEFE